MAVLGHGPLPSRGVLERVGWEVSCRDMAPCGVCTCTLQGLYPGAGGQMRVPSKGTGGEISTAQTCTLRISCALLSHPLWLLSQRNGWAGPPQWRVCSTSARLHYRFLLKLGFKILWSQKGKKKKGTRKISIKGRREQRGKNWGRNFKMKQRNLSIPPLQNAQAV